MLWCHLRSAGLPPTEVVEQQPSEDGGADQDMPEADLEGLLGATPEDLPVPVAPGVVLGNTHGLVRAWRL